MPVVVVWTGHNGSEMVWALHQEANHSGKFEVIGAAVKRYTQVRLATMENALNTYAVLLFASVNGEFYFQQR